MTKLFPLMIITLIVVLVAPFATDFIGGLTLDLADTTAARIAGQ